MINKTIPPKLIALTFGVLTISFLAVFYIFAWTEPTNFPPTCPAGQPGCDAPLNIGPTGQSKEGGLILNTGGAATGLIIDKGNVGIGTVSPAAKLEVVGDIISKGTSWTSRTSAAANQWYSVTYGNGLFVAVSTSGSGNRVMTSPDGVNWTSRTSAADNGWVSVTYGNGLFIAVSYNGSGNRVMTSPDGVNWTSRTSAANNDWASVTYGNGLFVAVSTSGSGNRVMTSPDGVNWTSRTSAANNDWASVTYGNGLFVAVSWDGLGGVMTSSDGITWTPRTSPANQWYSVTYGNGLFVAVADNGPVMTSPDGVNWTSRTSAANNDWASVTYGNGLFVAVSTSGSGNRVMTSPDGINWISRTSAASFPWRSVTYGNGLFVAVSYDNAVMTSGKAELNIIPSAQRLCSPTKAVDGSGEACLSGIEGAVTKVGSLGTTRVRGFTLTNTGSPSAESYITVPGSIGATQILTREICIPDGSPDDGYDCKTSWPAVAGDTRCDTQGLCTDVYAKQDVRALNMYADNLITVKNITASNDISAANNVSSQFFYEQGSRLQRRVTGTCTGQVMVSINQDGTVTCEADDTGAGGGAPTSASYVVIGLDGTLTSERKLTAGSGISITDEGANGNVIISATGGGGGLPAGSQNQTLRHDGTNWVADSVLINSGTNIGIYKATPEYKLDVGSGDIAIRNGNLRLFGRIEDTFGGGSQYYLDLDTNGNIKNLSVEGSLTAGSVGVTGSVDVGGNVTVGGIIRGDGSGIRNLPPPSVQRSTATRDCGKEGMGSTIVSMARDDRSICWLSGYSPDDLNGQEIALCDVYPDQGWWRLKAMVQNCGNQGIWCAAGCATW